MNIERSYAPVVLFAYARPDHTLRTLNALRDNFLAEKTELYVFLDFPKKAEHRADYESVVDIVNKVNGDFKEIHIEARTENFGLAKNIMSGVSEVINKHGKVIVLEDDLVTSKYFLTFMNDALTEYKSNESIWHISGWTHPIDFGINEDTFAWRTMNCWGWATWAENWQFFEKNPQSLVSNFTKEDISKFNLDNTHNFWKQVEANLDGRLNTWAIFWYATIYKNNGLCINPTKTYIQNIGNDGSGENCGNWDIFTSPLAQSSPNEWPKKLTQENLTAVKAIKRFYKKNYPSLIIRAFRKAWRLIS